MDVSVGLSFFAEVEPSMVTRAYRVLAARLLGQFDVALASEVGFSDLQRAKDALKSGWEARLHPRLNVGIRGTLQVEVTARVQRGTHPATENLQRNSRILKQAREYIDRKAASMSGRFSAAQLRSAS